MKGLTMLKQPLKPLLMGGLLLCSSFLASGLLTSAAHAAAPMAKTQAPGYFRMMLGAFEITSISDGTVALPVDKLLNAPVAQTQQALAKAFVSAPLETSVNAYLINTGSQLVLVDAGAGSVFGPTLGKLVANLKLSGYTPEQVDAILITHLHGDHAGGLMAGAERIFPNAKVYLDQKEADYWLSKSLMEQAAEDKKGGFQTAMNALNPYVAAKKLAPFKGDSQILPGIKARASYGHTAGHSAYEVESEGQKLLLIGDLIHVAAVQMQHPEITIAFDSDQASAAKTRAMVFAQAAKDGLLIGATHLQFPGLGHLSTSHKGYRWLPLNYTQMP
jgi:glyoxylase-like metal-dependent hydrolase (beta-lactamase superfamily II)